MNSEILRLGLIVFVAIAVLYVYQNGLGSLNLIKNTGVVSETPAETTEESTPTQETAPVAADLSMSEQPMVVSERSNVNTNNEEVHGRVDDLAESRQDVAPSSTMSSGNCFPQGQLSAKDLLPREDANGSFAASNPSVPGQLSDKNFLESGHHFGINTVGQSLKNPNLQVRSDPLIPQKSVGPWMQSTITADTNRRPFEIQN